MTAEYLKHCTLCPRECGVNRQKGERGFCGAGAKVRIARATPHFWEEPCISGKNGSGTVFFSGCTMKCLYCQNYEVSANNLGVDVTEEELAEIFLNLSRLKVNNINLVTPAHYAPQIIAALDIARRAGLNIPTVFNSGGYESVKTLREMEGYIDIYMPDFKYYSDKYAVMYSSAPKYRDFALSAIREMYRQVGNPVFDDNGIMLKGVVIRHLMIPSRLSDTVKIVNCVHNEFGDGVYFSLMSQYTPLRPNLKFPELNRRISLRAYNAATELCERLGMENVFVQDSAAADESFVPEFSDDKTKLGIDNTVRNRNGQ